MTPEKVYECSDFQKNYFLKLLIFVKFRKSAKWFIIGSVKRKC